MMNGKKKMSKSTKKTSYSAMGSMKKTSRKKGMKK